VGCPIRTYILKGGDIPGSGFVNRVIATDDEIFQVPKRDPKAKGLPWHGGQRKASVAWTLHPRKGEVEAKGTRGRA
jgi:hypothetical protein